MPRKPLSPAASILSFFRTASLDVAETVLALATDAVKERRPSTTSKPVGAKPGRKPKVVAPAHGDGPVGITTERSVEVVTSPAAKG